MSTLPLVIRTSATGKMPCQSYSLPAQACITGSKLAKMANTVCSGCYALKGRYSMPNVREPRDWNLAVWKQTVSSGDVASWSEAVARAIKPNATHFRWFDSGDIQSVSMLGAIVAVAMLRPEVRFWLPTKERGILKAYLNMGGIVPENLCIRVSSYALGEHDTFEAFPTSTVQMEGVGMTCKAYTQGGKCLDCRACWDSSVANINYPLH